MGLTIFVRHGESGFNALDKGRRAFCGQTETPLTEKGKEQAREAGLLLAPYQISMAISSSLRRALDTATFALEGSVPLSISDGLIERSLGDFEGHEEEMIYRKHPEYQHHPDYNHFRFHPSQKAPRGENIADVLSRAWPVLMEAERKAQGRLAVFSHHNTILCLLMKALNLTFDQAKKIKIPNAKPIVLERSTKGHRLISGIDRNNDVSM